MKVNDILEICEPVWIDNDVCLEFKPKFSVLLPTFRRAKSGLFERCITSVLGQTFKDFELIIIDDASTDGTSDIIKKYMKIDRRVKCIHHTYNVGLPAISEYEAYLKAKGELIAFIFDDCVWEKDFLQQINTLFREKTISCCYSIVKSYYGKNREDYVVLGQSSNLVGTNSLSILNYIPNSGVILTREVIEDSRCGLYDPHLAQTRLCDWSLWKRINKYYTFYETGILCGCEYGVSTNDSLGNTYEMHLGAALEREIDAKTIDFSPQNFGEIDIEYTSKLSTDLYKNAVKTLMEGFSLKKWYVANVSDITSRKVICIIGAIDASLQISFEAYSKNNRLDDLFFRFIGVPSNISDVIQADAVVCVRNQIQGEIDWLDVCNSYGIPCFYFTDDNFEVLSEEHDIPYIKEEANLWKKERFNQYTGLIVASENLRKFFIEKKDIESERIYYLPCMPAERIVELNADSSDKTITFAYIGGMWRNKCFIDVFLPQLRELSKLKKIRLIICDDDSLEFDQEGKIDVVRVARRLNLPELLRDVRQYHPNFLIHCGYQQPNDNYKNINALFNALSIGAVLITNDIMPYNSSELNKALLLLKDASDLVPIISNNSIGADYWKTMYGNALKICDEKYDYEANKCILEDIFKDVVNCSKYSLSRRIEKYIASDSKGALQKNIEAQIYHRPTVSPDKLRLSKTFYKSKKYSICCDRESIKSLSFIFTSFDSYNTEGFIRLNLRYKGKIIRSVSRNIAEITNNNWVDFEFQEINNCSGLVFQIQFDLIFSGEKKKYGIYELTPNTTFLWRILNYFNIATKDNNVLLFCAQ
ncbi:MAG: glycosyltransferase family 2 protein [Pseudobutyrivibrio ruminis]|uniref:glycosyltransferase family 2 protein n=1 Tax=Pseudobutyrivibrio ruminis TaxID=46206 RepID=UPI0026EC3658|nr:glycosyltransferase family 2 protein [Pseudobutyrivibrio ruminis]MBE5913522.1 glycosyltransferase family 2 protein [Pseudobutyrivibrio ruminis]